MPSPKNYMDDKHSYVRGYVRRKHVKPDLSPEDLEYLAKSKKRRLILNITIWIVHLIALVTTIALCFSFDKNPQLEGWKFTFLSIFLLLFGLLVVRISILLNIRPHRSNSSRRAGRGGWF